MVAGEELIRIAGDCGASHAALLDASAIRFHEDFRKACERNVCGRYGTSWMGPPAVGSIAELREKVSRYRLGLLFQTVHAIAGSFDMKGMLQAAKAHGAVFRGFLRTVRKRHPDEELLPLDAGCCGYCEKCAYLDGEPCRNPEEALASVEAYGMDVAVLMKRSGMPYNHGKGSVGFVGMVLFNPQPQP